MERQEKYFIAEDYGDGTLEATEWFKNAKKAQRTAKEQAKGLRHPDHSILVCKVLSEHTKTVKAKSSPLVLRREA